MGSRAFLEAGSKKQIELELGSNLENEQDEEESTEDEEELEIESGTPQQVLVSGESIYSTGMGVAGSTLNGGRGWAWATGTPTTGATGDHWTV